MQICCVPTEVPVCSVHLPLLSGNAPVPLTRQPRRWEGQLQYGFHHTVLSDTADLQCAHGGSSCQCPPQYDKSQSGWNGNGFGPGGCCCESWGAPHLRTSCLRVWDVVSNTRQKYSKWSFDMPCQIVIALGLPQMGVSMRVGASTGNVPLSA